MFDSKVLAERIAFLKKSLPEGTALCYAVKANPFVTGEIGEEVERLEICSPGEEEICRSLGIDSRRMVISGVYKTPSVLRRLAADESFQGIITIESVLQYQQLCTDAQGRQHPLRLLLRLTNGSQFGLDEQDLDQIVQQREQFPFLELAGVQFFSGTQKNSVKKFARELTYLDQYLLSLRERFGYQAAELEYGTGFPVSYFVGEELDETTLLREFSALLKELKCGSRIILELGRSMVASCGKYYTHIVDIKVNKGQHYALTDGGLHHITYFGQFMAMKQPYLSVVGKTDVLADKDFTICGALCTMNDILVKQVHLPEIRVGDVLCFERAGAYCMTEGISLLLSRDLPAIYLRGQDGALYRLRSPFETYIINQPKYERMF